MVSRRSFLSMLTGAAGAAVLPWRIPNPIISLPPPAGFETDGLLFKATERYSAGFTDWRGVWGTCGDGVALTSAFHPYKIVSEEVEIDGAPLLNDAALERLWIDIQEQTQHRGLLLSMKPTSLIFPGGG